MVITSTIIQLFSEKGGNAYIGEPVTQLEHAIQTAQAATRYNARAELITAALLHDIGHFLHEHDEHCADDNIDSQHERVGEQFLRQYFKPEIAELVKHHVNAKRYLTAIDENYFKNLSAASLKSLQLQGGQMDASEIKNFRAHPLFEEILLLRYWDEGAKIPFKKLPPITYFTPILESCLL